VWIDRPYATAVNTFDFNPATYSDPGAMVAEVNGLGLRLALWHTPYLEPEGAAALHAEAQAAGYFPPNVPIIFNGWSEPIDFTNPAAVTWWQGLLGAYSALGVEGYKLDYGEDVILGLNGNRLGWLFADGSDERTMHKGYMRGYHSTYAATLPEDGGFLLCRAGTWGDQVNVNVIWPGDLDADMAYHREPREDGSLSVGGLPAGAPDADGAASASALHCGPGLLSAVDVSVPPHGGSLSRASPPRSASPACASHGWRSMAALSSRAAGSRTMSRRMRSLADSDTSAHSAPSSEYAAARARRLMSATGRSPVGSKGCEPDRMTYSSTPNEKVSNLKS
jgi:hypothetical protein